MNFMAQHPVLYRHTDFVVIHKAEGIAVHADEDSLLLPQVAVQLGVERVWLVHRLDKPTSGALLLALTAPAASTLATLFADRKVQKTYVALSDHKPSKKQGWVKGDMEKARRGAWKLLRSMHNPAVTHFTSQGLGNGTRLFTLHPHTGKTHQLRVAMKSLGSPILGDTLYGGTAAERVYLHAQRLQFTYGGEDITVEAPIPWLM